MHERDTILLLGGTTEAYFLAEQFHALGFPVLSSLAGRTTHPKIPVGRYRIGGFGGVDGLVDTIRKEKIGLIIDATHPFAQTITDHAWRAAQLAKISYIRFERPLWQPTPQDKWKMVASIEEAVKAIPEHSRCFLAIGRQHLAPFLLRDDVFFVARMVEKPENIEQTQNLEIVLSKPKTEKEEREFLTKHHFNCLVCRNSGGTASFPKLDAARKLELPVIMITRRQRPEIVPLTTEDDVIDFVCKFFPMGRAEMYKATNG